MKKIKVSIYGKYAYTIKAPKRSKPAKFPSLERRSKTIWNNLLITLQ